MDFCAVARETMNWAETPSGALVVYPAAMVVGVSLGYVGSRLKKWYESNCRPPERKPFEGIPTQELPKSEPKG